jgi:hypothetical protein
VERRTFNYRSGGLWFVTAFLWIWAGGWLWGVGSSWSNPRVTVNDRLVEGQEAMGYLFVFLGIGLAVAGIAVATLLYVVNCRIEIAHEFISWYNFLGRLKVRGTLGSARITEAAGQFSKAVIETDGGDIDVRYGLNDYGMLFSLLTGRGSLEGEAPKSPPGFVPASSSYDYRWTYLHFFSFLWLGVIGFMAAMGLRPETKGKEAMFALIPFAAIGVWMQLTAWFERIELGPDGIRWIDWRGKTRVSARLDQIVSTDVVRGDRSASLQIHTTVGTIRASSQLRGGETLMSQVDRVILTAGQGGGDDLADMRRSPSGSLQGRW